MHCPPAQTYVQVSRGVLVTRRIPGRLRGADSLPVALAGYGEESDVPCLVERLVDDDSAETTLAGRLSCPLRPVVVARLGVLTCHALAREGRQQGDLCPSAILLVTSAKGDLTVTVRA